MTNSENIKTNGSYYCPMNCEGDKVYDQPGNCPVCNMHLVPVDSQLASNHSMGHDHVKNGDHENHQHNHSGHSNIISTNSTGKYYCPMRCEGDKVYDESGECPVCGMHLKKEESTSGSKMVYTCPMHPEVKQNEPGSCPKCGMDLVPEKGEETSGEF